MSGTDNFPGGTVVKNLPANVGDTIDTGSIPGSGRYPGIGNGNPTPLFLPRKFHGQRNLVGYRPYGHKESDTTEQMQVHAHTRTYTHGFSNGSMSLP